MHSGSPGRRYTKEHVARISDQVCGILDTFDNEAMIFCKVVDCILIGLGRPVALRIEGPDGQPLTFETSADAEFLKREVRFFNAFSIRLGALSGTKSPDTKYAADLSEEYSFLDDLSKAALGSTTDEVRRKAFSQALKDGLTKISPRRDFNFSRTRHSAKKRELQTVFEAIDEKLETFSSAYRFTLADDAEASFPRLFFFRREISQDQEVRVQLHLLPSQVQACLSCEQRMPTALVGPPPSGECRAASSPCLSDLLESGLASARWDDLDDVFRVGFASWIRWPWDITNVSKETSGAEIARSLLFHLGTEDSRRKHRPVPPALAVPIHVGGVPWLIALLVFTSEAREHDRLELGYRFYRDALDHLSTAIRQKASGVHTEWIQAAFMAGYGGQPILDHDAVNDELAKIAEALPFQRCHVLEEGDSRSTNDIAHAEIGGQTVRVLLTANPLESDAMIVNYETVSADDISALLQSVERTQSHVLRARLSHYEDLTHVLNGVMKSSGWESALRDLTKIEAKLKNRRDVAEFRSAVQAASRSLAMSSMVRGLGEFVQVAAADSGRLAWGKFNDWFDLESIGETAAHTRWANLDEFAEGIFRIAQVLCYGSGWDACTVKCPDAEKQHLKVQEWREGDEFKTLRLDALHFPPFKRGADGHYVYFFALAEPIINAVDAMGASKKIRRSEPLTLEIHRPTSHPDNIQVRIENLSPWSVNRQVSGIKSIQNLLRGLGFIEYLLPQSVPVGRNLYRVSLDVRISRESLLRKFRRGFSG